LGAAGFFSSGLFAGKGRAQMMLRRKDQNLRNTTMTITANRLSDTEVAVETTIYMFSDKVVADAFLLCIGQESLETCSANHAPMSSRAANEEKVDDLPPGSIISPSLGGMP